jgi:hypothetical protein
MMTKTTARKPQVVDLRSQWESRKSAFVDGAWTAMMHDCSMQAFYAYVRPSSANAWGELAYLREMDDIPAGFELVAAERIPAGTKEQIRHWFERFAGRLPVYPT